MSIIVCGINYKTAPVALREKVFFAEEKLPLYLEDLLASGTAREAVLLSTCNRSELYCEADDTAAVREWFCHQSAMPHERVETVYIYQGQKAVEHLMRVACGLDSMILGEPEILGQVKTAFAESCTAGAVASLFHDLFQYVFAVAKEIRGTTSIGACPVSIASTTIALAKSVLTSFADARILLLGAGSMIELLLRYLQSSPVQKTWIINRHKEKAVQLADKMGGEVRAWDEIAFILSQANVMITATGSILPVITTTFLEKALKSRKEPLYIFDIAVPRDVEAEAAVLPMVELYCIDDLKTVIQKNQLNRQHAADKAQEVVVQKSQAFMEHLISQAQVSDTICAYRKQIEAVCEQELNKALRQLANHQDAESVLRHFAYAITNKLLHAPSVQLRQAGTEGRFDILRLAKQLLNIPEMDVKTAGGATTAV